MSKQREIVEKWLEFTLSNLRENITKLKIQDTGHLLASVQGLLVGAAEGDVTKLSIAYAVYGQFVDMGVGRGMGAGIRRRDSDYARIRDARGALLKHNRKARKWYGPEIGRQSVRLGVLVSEWYGQNLIAKVAEAVPGTIDIGFEAAPTRRRR